MNLIVDSGHLPVGWQVKKLGDLCHLISGQHIEAKDYNIEHRGIGYLTGPSDFGLLYPVVSKWTEFPKKNASKGDILITVKGSGVGKINILLDDEVAISRQLMAIRPIEVHSDFLYAFLKLQFYFFQGLANGAAIPGLSRQDILGLEIPIPPLPEQKRIMVILDEAFEGIDRAIANTEKNLANSRELFESYLNAIFTQKGDGWVEKKLGEVCSIGDGNYSSKYPKASEFVSEGVPFLTATNLKGGTIVPDNMRYISKEQHSNLTKGHVIKDDLVIVVRGSSTGNNSIIPEEYEGSNLNSQLAYLRVKKNDLSSAYLFSVFNSPGVQKEVKNAISGSAQPQLPNNQLLDIKISYPSLIEQQAIVSKLKTLSTETKRLEAIYRQKLAALNELKQSILQKAFTGELTADTANHTTKATQEVSAA